MKECDSSKMHIKSIFIFSVCLLIMLDTLITRTITTLQHLATLHHTSPNCTSLQLSTLHFLSITLHNPLLYLKIRTTSAMTRNYTKLYSIRDLICPPLYNPLWKDGSSQSLTDGYVPILLKKIMLVKTINTNIWHIIDSQTHLFITFYY
jgi:hypothetical protein